MTLREFLARRLAARKMGLTEDTCGVQLPDERWIQAVSEVEFILEAIQQYELTEIVRQYHESAGDDDE